MSREENGVDHRNKKELFDVQLSNETSAWITRRSQFRDNNYKSSLSVGSPMTS